MDANRKRRLLVAAIATGAVSIGLAMLWRYTDLRDVLTLQNLVGMVEAISGKWWAPLVWALVYTPAALVMFPRPLLTLAAVIVFGPLKGFSIAMTGVLIAALVFYAWGRRIDEKRLRRWAGRRFDSLSKMLRKTGFMAFVTLGLLPVAPFAVEMLAAGALRARLRDLLPGVAVAHLPGMLSMTVLGDQIMAAISDGRQISPGVVVAVVVVLAAIAIFTRRAWRRMQAAA